ASRTNAPAWNRPTSLASATRWYWTSCTSASSSSSSRALDAKRPSQAITKPPRSGSSARTIWRPAGTPSDTRCGPKRKCTASAARAESVTMRTRLPAKPTSMTCAASVTRLDQLLVGQTAQRRGDLVADRRGRVRVGFLEHLGDLLAGVFAAAQSPDDRGGVVQIQ